MPEAVGFVALASVGAVCGSFSVTAAVRTAQGRPFILWQSQCDRCGTALGYWRTVPIAAFLVQRGACAECGGRIDRVHPLGEILGAAVLVAASAAAPPMRAALISALGLTLLAASIFDWRTLRLPDALTASVAVLAVALAATRSTAAVLSGVAAAIATVLVLEVIRRAYRRARGRDGLGLGDVKLAAALALWLGPSTPWAVVAASLLGLAISPGGPIGERFAWGPALAVGGFAIGLFEEAYRWPL